MVVTLWFLFRRSMTQQIGEGGDLRVSPVLVTKDGRKMQSVVCAWREDRVIERVSRKRVEVTIPVGH